MEMPRLRPHRLVALNGNVKLIEASTFIETRTALGLQIMDEHLLRYTKKDLRLY